ncbi:AgrD family cyclic lactone autoinducer peptide [Paratissierella segnis]|jgi:cyclic lactone autoinducer peptide|uniref:Cyclic lactone autoinducer peptide n=1 Tax=Paratissierella segnis TaxID=2763679 RepID=A0A926EV84_9FIRM|nr:cyclic lactone autoinducer peptide [Paratissierella segnis]MBC8587182.1 cyclic lactone autoinducer peptide [Paratissierella segnis]
MKKSNVKICIVCLIVLLSLTPKTCIGVGCWGALYQPKAPDSLKNI